MNDYLVNRLASYIRGANAEVSPGRMSLEYSRQLARGVLEQLTLNDLDDLRDMFP